jgi:hypothetical protein
MMTLGNKPRGIVPSIGNKKGYTVSTLGKKFEPVINSKTLFQSGMTPVGLHYHSSNSNEMMKEPVGLKQYKEKSNTFQIEKKKSHKNKNNSPYI